MLRYYHDLYINIRRISFYQNFKETFSWSSKACVHIYSCTYVGGIFGTNRVDRDTVVCKRRFNQALTGLRYTDAWIIITDSVTINKDVVSGYPHDSW